MGTGVGEAILVAVAAGAASAAVGQALAKPKTITPPEIKPVLEQPDPLAQKDAVKKKLVEQMKRSGRASTIMTDGAGTLGG